MGKEIPTIGKWLSKNSKKNTSETSARAKMTMRYLSRQNGGASYNPISNDYSSVSNNFSANPSKQHLEARIRKRPFSTSQNGSLSQVQEEEPISNSYYKNPIIKGNSPIASYYRNKPVSNKKLIKLSLLKKQKNFASLSMEFRLNV